PLGAVGPAVSHDRLAGRRVDQLLAGGALRAQPPPRDGAVGIALDLGDLVVLDVHVLAATDGAVRADRLDDAFGGSCSWGELGAALRLAGRSAAQRVVPRQLPVDRPLPDPGLDSHGRPPQMIMFTRVSPAVPPVHAS